MDSFSINGYTWRVKIVEPDNVKLVDRTNTQRVATTDPNEMCIYLSNELEGNFLVTVLRHEIGHAVIFSCGLLREIHSFVPPERWIEAEEWICNFLADYGSFILNTCYDILNR